MSSFKELLNRVTRKPKTREQLIVTLREAEQENLIDSEAEAMLEGVLQITEMQVRDIMLPKTEFVSVLSTQSLVDITKIVIEHLHSRYPVFNTDDENVIGVLLAKDLLKYTLPGQEDNFDINKIVQPAMFVPETQHLNKLLTEFKTRRTHMAIVVDEYGTLSGLVTMEDILEQIVGNIEDESDYDEDDGIKQYEGYYIIKASVEIEEFDEYFNSKLDDDGCETIGGFILNHLGHIPKRNEEFDFGEFHFKVLHADRRRIRLLQVSRG